MSILEAEQYFAQQFQKDLQQLGADTAARYAPVVQKYNRIIIPFEKSRTQERQTIIYQNSQLGHNNLNLACKLQQQKAQNQTLLHTLSQQEEDIKDLNLKIDQLQTLNCEQASMIESLKLRNQDYKAMIDHKNGVIAQMQKDSQALLEKYQVKEGEYNLLVANCMRDKNIIVQRLNQLNQKQLSLLEKDRELKEQQFYLRKQWEQLQENGQQTHQHPNQDKLTRMHSQTNISRKGPNPFKARHQAKNYEKCAKQEQSKHQILKSPLRKLIKHHQSEIYDLSFNDEGNILSSCAGDKHIKIYDITSSTTKLSITTHTDNLFTSIALEHQRLLAGSTNQTVTLYNSQSGQQLHSFLGHTDKVNSVTWSNCKQKCASGSDDKQLKLWDLQKLANLRSFGCQRSVKIVRSSHVQPLIYTGHVDGSIRMYSFSQSTPLCQIKGIMDYSITSLSLLSSGDQLLATSSEGSAIYLLDLKMNKVVRKYEHQRFYNSAARATLSPSEAFLLVGNCDGALYYWNRSTADFLAKISGHDGPVTALQYHRTSKTLATTDKQGTVILWR